MPTDPTTAHDAAAFLVLLHHVIFEMTAEQAAALMADDELITAAAHPGPPSTGMTHASLIQACEHAWEIL